MNKIKFWTQSDTWWSNLATFETFSPLYSDDEWTLSLDPDDDEQQQIMQNHPTTGKKTLKHKPPFKGRGANPNLGS